ncbi:MAG: response regulator [Gemmatimonadetes bacterium]|nr:response regulator [Gemmatimonadota bacterium]
MEKGEILVVEDNEENRDIFRTILEYGGYVVSVAEDGEQGLAAIKERRPDLVILDIGLPRMDGWELLRRLRESPNGLGDTQVMVVTADTSADGEARAARLGCVDFLTKPVEPRRLLARARKVLAGESLRENSSGSAH